MPSITSIVWKTPVVIGALVVGCMAASQVGWSGAESIADRGQAGFVTDLLLFGTLAISYGTVVLVQRIAKPMLWVMIPILLYFVIVPGAWNGFASDFDAGRREAIKHHYANGYILEHMSDRGRFLSCRDNRIALTDDAKAVCSRALNVPPGQRIPGSEHRCGLLGFLECFDTAPETVNRK
ncbi:MAG: hypothetical protein ABSE51_22355 [Terracidiphilus sp.]|jgi:hypothetical protein